MGQNAGENRRIAGMELGQHIIKEKKDILLTVVIPVYNGEKHLKETLEHIARIKFQRMEVLLIDDGSYDKSCMICREYEKYDDRIRYIRQNNQGTAESRNKGIEMARGEYICFWDQDDYVIPNGFFNLLHKTWSEHAPIGMCSTKRMIQGRISDYENIRDGVYLGREVQRKLLYPLLFRGYRYPFTDTGSYLYGSVWKCIFRTDFVRSRQIRFRKFVSYEDDWIFVTQALCYADKVVTGSKAGYCWRVNEESESHRGTYIEDLPERFVSFDKYVLNYLTGSIMDENVLAEYRKVNLCEHYADLYRNAANIRSDAGIKDRRQKSRERVKEYLRETDYKRQLICRKYLKRSAYRRQVVLNSLWYGGINITFIISRLYDRLEEGMSRVQWIVHLERNRKMGESN